MKLEGSEGGRGVGGVNSAVENTLQYMSNIIPRGSNLPAMASSPPSVLIKLITDASVCMYDSLLIIIDQTMVKYIFDLQCSLQNYDANCH